MKTPTFFGISIPVVRAYIQIKEAKKLPEAERRELNFRGKLYVAGFSDKEVEREVQKAREKGDWS